MDLPLGFILNMLGGYLLLIRPIFHSRACRQILGNWYSNENQFNITIYSSKSVLMAFNFDPYICSEFCNMVRKIFIYTTEEVKKLSHKTKLPVDDEGWAEKPVSDAAVGTLKSSHQMRGLVIDMPMSITCTTTKLENIGKKSDKWDKWVW